MPIIFADNETMTLIFTLKEERLCTIDALTPFRYKLKPKIEYKMFSITIHLTAAPAPNINNQDT